VVSSVGHLKGKRLLLNPGITRKRLKTIHNRVYGTYPYIPHLGKKNKKLEILVYFKSLFWESLEPTWTKFRICKEINADPKN